MNLPVRVLLQLGGIALVALSFTPYEAQASVVRFDGTLTLQGSSDGQVYCAVGSPCAQAFETDTGITPVNIEFAQGRLLFEYDTATHSILSGSSFTLSSFTDVDTATYNVSVSSLSAGGTFLVGCDAGISLRFGGASTGSNGSTISGRVNYCLPNTGPGSVVSLDDFVTSGRNTFGGAAYVTPVGSPSWGLSANGNTLRMISEPSTLSLGALALVAVCMRRRAAR